MDHNRAVFQETIHVQGYLFVFFSNTSKHKLRDRPSVPLAAPGYAGRLLCDRPVSRKAPVTVPWM